MRRNSNALRSYLKAEEISSLDAAFEAYEEARDCDEREYWLWEIRALKSCAVERVKRAFTKQAIELAKQHGLLPQDFTVEKYNEIALKVIEYVEELEE